MCTTREKTISVLVVDDNADTLLCTVRLLQKAGYAIDQATTGRQALDCLRQSRPNLVLLDVNLPDMDGRTACQP
jgi:CheY-like chemotaxis protein